MEGIKRLISLKITSNFVSSAVVENISLIKPEDIANAFNKYFVNISSTIQSTINFSRDKFHDFLLNIDINSFFIKAADKTEFQNIILSVNPLKAVGSNIIATKILKLHLIMILQISCLSCSIFHFPLVFFPRS